MKTRQFKTTAKCQGCVTKMKPYLNAIMSEEQWNVDLSGAEKILNVTAALPDEAIIAAVEKAGFKAIPIN